MNSLNIARLWFDRSYNSVRAAFQLACFLIRELKEAFLSFWAIKGELTEENAKEKVNEILDPLYDRTAAFCAAQPGIRHWLATRIIPALAMERFVRFGGNYQSILEEVRANVLHQLESGQFFIQLGELARAQNKAWDKQFSLERLEQQYEALAEQVMPLAQEVKASAMGEPDHMPDMAKAGQLFDLVFPVIQKELEQALTPQV